MQQSLFQRYREAGGSVADAIGRALESSGTGVLATTLIICMGFFLLGTSDFSLTAQKATMVGSAILIAFFFDLLAIPALLVVADRFAAWRSARKNTAVAL